MQTITVIDYGMGNLHSVVKALEYVAPNQKISLSNDLETIKAADRIVFPGQGAAKDCMQAIHANGLNETILETAKNKPFLGICMGMQVLVSHSEENGGTSCLGLYAANVSAFANPLVDNSGVHLKVPQMGWNSIRQAQHHPLWSGIPDNSRFYFVHSYFLDVMHSDLHAGTCNYGHDFSAVIAKDNVFAMQCHPEKSAEHGLQLLTNFTQWDGQT